MGRWAESQFKKQILPLGLAALLALGLYALSPYMPAWSCLGARLYVALAQGENCRTKCTDWNERPCSGYSSCYDKDISCSAGGSDQNGRSCRGCCFACKLVCDDPPDQPPAISGTLACEAWGLNGWCIGKETLELSATEPQGQQLLLSGDVDGTPFACPPANGPASCAVPLPEGEGTINYTATSTTGLSAGGATGWMRDSISPQIDGTLSGASGDGGWFLSAVEVSASALDPVSGLASLEYNLDGGVYQPYSAPFALTDGGHTLQFRATDLAGNQSEISQKVNVDTSPPNIDMPGAWELGRTVGFEVQDSSSGLSRVRVVVADEHERFPKVAWQESLSAVAYSGEIAWDGRWGDGSLAVPGEYLAWVKATDGAGNEGRQYGIVSVPQRSHSAPLLVLPTPTATFTPVPAPLGANLPAVPVVESASPGGAPPVASVAFGVSGKSAAQPASTNPIFWGAAAAGVTGAFMAEVARRKHKEGRARRSSGYLARVRAKKLARLEAEWAAERAQAEAREQAEHDARFTRKEALLEPEIPPAPKDPAYILPDVSWKQGDYAQLEHAREVAGTSKPKSWGEKVWWDKLSSIAQEWIGQPFIEKAYKPFIQPVVERIKTVPFFKTVKNWLTPKNIASSVIALTLGAGTLQWIDNVRSDPDIFLPVQAYAEIQTEGLRGKFPLSPEERTLQYLLTHPYDVVSTGNELLNAFTSISAAYADAVWQHNALLIAHIGYLESLENALCGSIASQPWSNRCTATFYLAGSLEATPFDTTLGVVNGLITDPIAGVIKQAALTVENVEAVPGLIVVVREEGVAGGKDYVVNLFNKNLKHYLNDGQLQSALFIETLLLLGIVSIPVAGGIVLGAIGKGFIDLDAAVASTKDKISLIQFVTSHEVRTAVVTSLVILALITAGMGKKVSEFRAFQEKLSPSAQASLQSLTVLEQTRLADLAGKMKLSPGAVEFYLDQISRPNSPLAEIPLKDALQLSTLAEQSGKGSFISDYILRYGVDTAIRSISAEGLQFYVEQAKVPGSIMSSLSPREGVILSQLSSDSIAKVTGMTTPTIPKGVTPGVNTPVLGLTSQEISVLLKLSYINPNAEYAVIGLWRGGSGYTLVGSTEGYGYLSMPAAIYDTFFINYLGDFRLVNKQFLAELASQRKLIILETAYSELRLNYRHSSAYWEAETLLKEFNYILSKGSGLSSNDILLLP